MVDSSLLPVAPLFESSPSSEARSPVPPRPPAPPPLPLRAPSDDALRTESEDVPDALQGAAFEVIACVKDLVKETRSLREARRAADTERAALEKGMASLLRIAATFGAAKAELLEGLRIEVAMECETRLAAQKREHDQQVLSLTAELEGTLAELAALKAERDAGEPSGQGDVEPTEEQGELIADESEPEAESAKRPTAPKRRRRRRRF